MNESAPHRPLPARPAVRAAARRLRAAGRRTPPLAGRDASAARSPSPTRTAAGSATAISPANTGSSISASPSAPTSARPTCSRSARPAPVRDERPGARGAGPADLHQRRSGARHAGRCCASYVAAFHPAPDRPHRQRGARSPRSRARYRRLLRARRGRRRAAAILVNHSRHGGAVRARRRADRDRSRTTRAPEAVAAELERWVR